MTTFETGLFLNRIPYAKAGSGANPIIVLNGGRVVEQGPALEVIRNPTDSYTRTLLEAIPNPFETEPVEQVS